MKVGIIIFHRAINYGAVLQAYALQTVIKKLGHNVEMIDYRCTLLENQYSAYQAIKNSKSLKYTIYLFLKKLYPMVKKKINVEKFIDKYLNLSQPYYKNSIKKAEGIYDKVFTGSDQVWNYNHADFDKTYFLDFISDTSKKCSYSASIGVSELPDYVVEDYQRLLGTFGNLSVREISGKRIINNILPEKEVEVSIDPTLLLDKEAWEKVADKNRFKQNYVLVYELIPSDSLVEYAKKIAKEKNIKVFRISSDMKKVRGVKNLYGVSPQEFVQLIANAQVVCTNSFHGTAFSLNFNKCMYVELLKAPYEKLNARILDLLENCNATDRIIGQTKKEECTFDSINKYILQERNRAMVYLQGILGE